MSRLKGKTKILMPWTDYDGKRNWAILTFTGDVDKRRVYREIRKFTKHTFGNSVHKLWIRNVPIIINEPPELDTIDAKIEAWINRIQDEDNDQGHSTNQEEAVNQTGEQVRSL